MPMDTFAVDTHRPPTATAIAHPRLCFVGPMLGVHPGWVTSQGEILARLLAAEGYSVRQTSHRLGRLPRLADTLRCLVAWRNDIDLVIHQVYSGPAFVMTDLASALCRVLGLRQVFTLHGGSLPEFAAARPGWVRRVLRRADYITSPSAYLVERVVYPLLPTPPETERGSSTLATTGTRVANPRDRARVIPNILDIEQYPYRHRAAVAPRLLWMRTFHDIYHPELAVETLAEVRRTHPAATLTMAGQEKGRRDAVMALAEASGLAEAVRFPGFLDAAGKAREFAAHDIFLNTNRVDNMPVSVVEAAPFGLPVVATAVGGIPYLLADGRTALLTPPEDAPAMAAAVRRLLAEPSLAAALSANGRRLAELCAWEPVRAQWQQLFREVLDA